jgi:tetratricopeptide (TPR) repeat protein
MKLIDNIDTSNLLINLDELDSMDIESLFHKAVNQFNYGYTREAYFIFKKVVEIDPAYIHNSWEDGGDNAYFYLGMLYRYHIKDIDGAIELFTKSVELCPHDGTSWENRGYCWMDKGKYEKAISDFENALKGDFGDTDEEEIKGAIKEAKEALKKESD